MRMRARAVAALLRGSADWRLRVRDGGAEEAAACVAEATLGGGRGGGGGEAKKRRRAEEEEDAVVPGLSDCAKCGGVRCVESCTMVGGGTYAQEREVLQKEVCRLCGWTERW